MQNVNDQVRVGINDSEGFTHDWPLERRASSAVPLVISRSRAGVPTVRRVTYAALAAGDPSAIAIF